MLRTIADFVGFPACALPRRRLLVIRHTESETCTGECGIEHRLTPSGREAALRLGRMLRARGLQPDAILSSPDAPAIQTAQRIASTAGCRVAPIVDAAWVQEGPHALRAVLAALPADCRIGAIVGSGDAVVELVACATAEREVLVAGGLAVFEVERWPSNGVATGRLRLVELWRPRAHSEVLGTRHAGSKWVNASRGERVVAVAMRALEWRFDRVLDDTARLLERARPDDVEEVRRLRVATRRAQASLRVFAGLLPRRSAARMSDELRRLRRAASAVRDVDVAISCLESRVLATDLQAFVTRLHERRRVARLELTESLQRATREARLARRMTSLQRRGRLREAGEAGARKPFEAWAPGAWERQVDRFLSRAGSVAVGDDVAQLHDLRLDAKKLRYVLEILASSLPARVRTVGYPALVEVQDRLGRLCDHWLAACVVQDTAPLLEPSDTAVSVERLVSIEHDSAERARREFFSWWTVGQWAALRSALAGS